MKDKSSGFSASDVLHHPYEGHLGEKFGRKWSSSPFEGHISGNFSRK